LKTNKAEIAKEEKADTKKPANLLSNVIRSPRTKKDKGVYFVPNPGLWHCE
jgi:hypothetical protein